MFSELVTVVRSSGRGFATYLADVLLRCKVSTYHQLFTISASSAQNIAYAHQMHTTVHQLQYITVNDHHEELAPRFLYNIVTVQHVYRLKDEALVISCRVSSPDRLCFSVCAGTEDAAELPALDGPLSAGRAAPGDHSHRGHHRVQRGDVSRGVDWRRRRDRVGAHAPAQLHRDAADPAHQVSGLRTREHGESGGRGGLTGGCPPREWRQCEY